MGSNFTCTIPQVQTVSIPLCLRDVYCIDMQNLLLYVKQQRSQCTVLDVLACLKCCQSTLPGVCNPYEYFGYPNIWPRGYPLDQIKAPSCASFARTEARPLVLQVCDAPTALSRTHGLFHSVCLVWQQAACMCFILPKVSHKVSQLHHTVAVLSKICIVDKTLCHVPVSCRDWQTWILMWMQFIG